MKVIAPGKRTGNSTRIECDTPGCQAAFTTFSLSTFAYRQAARMGWRRLSLRRFECWKELGLGARGDRKMDVCAVHAVSISQGYASRMAEATRLRQLASQERARARDEERALAREQRNRKKLERAQQQISRVQKKSAASKLARGKRAARRDPQLHSERTEGGGDLASNAAPG